MSADSRDRDPSAVCADAPLDINSIRQSCGARTLGSKFYYFTDLDSTNTCARALAESGAAEGEVVLAEAQRNGRGRLGRPWISPPKTNLYLSIVLRPRLPPAQAPQITLMAAIALVETLQAFLPMTPVIKWPNDVLVGDKKIAGILSEIACDAQRVEFVILGIGVNVNFAVALMPDELRHRATSVCELCGSTVSRERLLQRLIHDLDRCYGKLQEFGFAALAPLWQTHFGLRGRRVRVELLDQVVLGTALGIDREGALIIQDDRGEMQRIIAGDVIPVSAT
jgi:BirA family transcriptional regulator, biotin operon repressor / biotin---[acetyl-CoA-carboxylase] ligase